MADDGIKLEKIAGKVPRELEAERIEVQAVDAVGYPNLLVLQITERPDKVRVRSEIILNYNAVEPAAEIELDLPLGALADIGLVRPLEVDDADDGFGFFEYFAECFHKSLP